MTKAQDTPTTAAKSLTRREAGSLAIIGAIAAVTGSATLPALSLPAIASDGAEIEQLWRKRAALKELARENSVALRRAHDALPAWANSGPALMARDGTYEKDVYVGWPEIENPQPPKYGDFARVRPSLFDIRREYTNSPFVGSTKARARYHARVRAFIARLREQRRLQDDAGISAMGSKSEQVGDEIWQIEQAIDQTGSPGAFSSLAASALIELSYVGDDNDAGKLAVRVLRTVLPELSGQIAVAAAEAIATQQSVGAQA